MFFDPDTGQSLRQMIVKHNSEFRRNGQPHVQRKETTQPRIDYTHTDLVSATDSTPIRDRWSQSFLPTTAQRAKILPPHTIQYLSCIFRSYSRQLLRPECYPPFIHPLQTVDGELPLSLANCFSLIRMWLRREHGSDAMVTETVKNEMQRLFDEVGTHTPAVTDTISLRARSLAAACFSHPSLVRGLNHVPEWTRSCSSLPRSQICVHAGGALRAMLRSLPQELR